MKILAPHRAATLLTALSVLALVAALLTERVLGYPPCELCLLERWPYRVAIALGLLATVLPRWRRLLLALLALTFLVGAALGVLHVGVEQGWWPSPLPECNAPDLSGLSPAERLARMPLRPAKPCDEPTYLIPGLPVSMALMNLVLSLALAAAAAISATRNRRLP